MSVKKTKKLHKSSYPVKYYILNIYLFITIKFGGTKKGVTIDDKTKDMMMMNFFMTLFTFLTGGVNATPLFSADSMPARQSDYDKTI